MHTLQDVLLDAAASDKGMYEITGSGEHFIPYRDLLQTSLEVLHLLQSAGVAPRDEVILYMEDSSRFLHAFWACILGNIIPIPLTASSSKEHMIKLNNICRILRNPYLITDIKPKLDSGEQSLSESMIISYDKRDIAAKEGQICRIEPEQIAFIQFSSGSTGDPKGVTLTHLNLLTNIRAIINGMEFSRHDRSLNWMPFTHDMGLIGGHLTPLTAGSDQFQMPTELFVRRPVLWIKKAAEYHINYLSSPNFGYGYFLDYVKDSDLQGLDLSAVKLILNGAEPISAAVCAQFASRLRPFGLSENVWFPVYGMAEASLAVTFPRIGDGLRTVTLDRRTLNIGRKVEFTAASEPYGAIFADEGYPVQDCKVKICGEEYDTLPEDTIGHIYISGNNVTKGYYNNNSATDAVMMEDGWLKTGDLGLLHKGRLIVTGREKDIIFIHGQNVYPSDIERIAEQSEGIKPGRIVACGVRGEYGGDELVLFLYTPKTDFDHFVPLLMRLKQTIKDASGIMVKEVIPIRRIPKTTSGKVQRYQLASRYEAGEFVELLERIQAELAERCSTAAPREPKTDTERLLMKLLKEAVSKETTDRIGDLTVASSFHQIGMDSLKATYFAAQISEQFLVHVPVSSLITADTIEKLAHYIENERKLSSGMPLQGFQQESAAGSDKIHAPSSLERLYVMDMMKEAGDANHLTLVLKTVHRRSLEEWNRALREVAAHHDSLRMSFYIENTELFLDFAGEWNYEFEQIPMHIDPESSVLNWIRPFDLHNPPLWRAGILPLRDEIQLVFDFHHTVIDGTSAIIFLQDLVAVISGESITEAHASYKDVCLRYAKDLESGLLDGHKKYWISQFKDHLPVLELPTDKPRPLHKSFAGASLRFDADTLLTSKLKNFAENNRSTLYILLLAAYYQLLSKYSGQEDIVIGTPFANRSQSKLNRTIGMLINTLPLRINTSQDQSFAALLSGLKKMVYEAIDHQSYLCEDLIRELNIQPVSNRNSLYDTVFSMQNFIPASGGQELQLDWIELPGRTSKVDLSLECKEQDGNLTFTLEYSTELFHQDTMDRLVEHYIQILKAVTESQAIRLQDIDMVPAQEKHQLALFSGNKSLEAGSDKGSAFVPFAMQFAVRAKMNPEAVAFSYEGRIMTYGELDRISDVLAADLIEKGIGKESVAAVMAWNGAGQFVALLGVWKAGAACLPIDPVYPMERIEYMVEDCPPRIIISDHSLSEELFPQYERMHLPDYIGHNSVPSKRRKALSLTEPQDLALILYTSGTTGKPKGIMLEHGNLSAYINAFQEEFRIGPQDVVLQQSSFAFDNFIEEVLPALSSGASLLVMKKEDVLNLPLLERQLKVSNVSVISCSCLLLNELNKIEIPASVRLMISGGDTLKPEYISNLIGRCDVYNTYGPTETTVCAAYYRCTPEQERYPIGKPITGYRIYIVDSCHKEVPIGVAGQICIAGLGVARGYIGKEELTNERFGEHFIAGERVYLTGDYGRWLQDGSIEFMGRQDRQIKIRGHRVELDEAEQAVGQCSGVKEVRIVPNREEGAAVLCAYFIPDRPVTAAELREQLIRKVPEYMIPSYFVEVHQFPMTTQGKLDVGRLPKPQSNLRNELQYEPPQGAVEERLSELWCSLLDRSNIGAHEQFFTIGGHSLKAAILMNIINEEFHLSLTIRDLFLKPTIRQLARLISGSVLHDYASILVTDRSIREWPASHAQSRMYLLHELDPISTGYHISRALLIDGKLELVRLREALQELVDRHESLRTSFHFVDGMVRQRIHDKIALKWTVQNAAVEELDTSISQAIKPFVLNEPGLIRTVLFQLAPLRHVLLIDMHHIITDAVSVSVLLEEFQTIYFKGLRQPVPALQYRDYAAWHSRLLETGQLEEQRKFWLNQFDTLPEPLHFPLDFPRPPVLKAAGKTYSFKIDGALLEGLEDVCRVNGATQYMLLLSAYALLISKYTGQADLVIGSPAAGRTHKDVQGIVGMFVNTLPIRIRTVSDLTLIDLINNVKDTVIQALNAQDYPLDALVDQLDLPRERSRNPLFDTAFVMQNVPVPAMHGEGMQIKNYPLAQETSMFDLSLECTAADKELMFVFEYSTELFLDTTIERMADHYLQVLRSITESTAARLKDVSLLSLNEIEQLQAWGRGAARPIPEASMIEQFMQQANRTPEKTAVKNETEHFTYRELDQISGALAWKLHTMELGFKPIIAVCMSRGPQQLAALLAVWKAGGTYVPIDLEYPADRIRYILEDSKAQLIMTDGEVKTDNTSALIWNINDCTNDESGPVWNVTNHPTDLAYIVYTSGTTGRPKGVMVEHRNVISYVEAFQSEFGLGQDDVILQQASIAFDTYVEEVYPALSAGASLVIANKELLLQPALLGEMLRNHSISVISCSPLLLKEINKLPVVKSLRLAISGGDILKPGYVDQLLKYCMVYNTYGPTETTVCASYYKVRGGETRVPIGKPIANSSLYILGDDFQPVPIGVTGQICIGGAGLSRGYLGREDLTKEKFREHQTLEEQRLYLTGDLGRWLPDGNMDYMGRSDQQVNIRGYRIETSEVEAALNKYPSIIEAAVIPRIEDDEPYLCAYVISRSDWTVKQLRSYLGLTLPSYMIPSFFVEVDRIPVTANGKVDLRKLPDPKKALPAEAGCPAARSETERQLIEIWQEVLRIPCVSIHSDFFELGGHSLKALELVHRIGEKLNVRIEAGAVFTYSRLDEMAEYISSVSHDQTDKVFIEKLPLQNSYQLSSSQRRLYIIEQLEEPGTAYHMPAAFQIAGSLSMPDLEKAWIRLLEQHEILRTSFDVVDGEPRMIVHDQLDSSSFRILEGPQMVSDLIEPFDLSQAPLCRMTVIQESEEVCTLLIDMHHLISDAMTCDLLFHDFQALYTGETLNPPHLQYKDYAAWQNAMDLQLQDQMKYWHNILSGELPVLQFPYDFHQELDTGLSEAGRLEFELEASAYIAVKALAAALRVTPYMILLAAYYVLLSKYTGQEDIIALVPVSGRSRPEFDRIAGMFVNTLAIRSTPQGHISFAEYLQEIRHAVAGAFDHQDIPLERLIDELNEKEPGRSIHLKSLSKTMFSMREEAEHFRTFAGLDAQVITLQSPVSKFDFGIEVVDRSDKYTLELVYAKALFSPLTMERFGRGYMNILKAFTNNPQLTIESAPVLSHEEALAQLAEFNPGLMKKPLRPIYMEVEEQAGRTPSRIAVEYEGSAITYERLNGSANDLAVQLRNMGVSSGCYIPVFMDRSIELVISLLAVMKTGAGFVPMDPSWPAQRIESIAADTRASVVLFDKAAGIPDCDFNGAELVGVRLDDLKTADNLEIYSGLEDPIYVIYTSGSTGKPKGVVVPHIGIANRFAWMNDYFGDYAAASVLQTTHHVFDSSVWQFFWPLTRGGKTVLPNAEYLLSAEYIASVIERSGITLTDFVPSVFNVIVDQLVNGSNELLQKLESLQSVIVGGEEVAAATVHKFQQLLPKIQLTNLYGPTEASIGCIYHQIDGAEKLRIPIGRPVYNTQILILDKNRRLVPPGVTGEIYISGLCLANGYLNDAEKTNSVFVPHAYPESGWDRMYKTGDLARYQSSGEIEYLGRSDFQVKIRGFRIELGEIESQIMNTETVKETVVAPVETGGQTMLCAYVVPYDIGVDTAELRRRLSRVLPGYMIPAVFVQLEAMPLSPSGKVDRKALPTPDWTEERAAEPAATELEADLMKIWNDVLGFDQFGVTDDFFMLGGHSLKLFALAASIHDQWGVRIPLKELYHLSTIRAQAQYMAEAVHPFREQTENEFTIFPADQTELIVSASSQQKALYVIAQLEGVGFAYHMPAVYEWIGEFDKERFNAVIQQLVDRHEALRTRFRMKNGALMQVILKREQAEISHYEAGDKPLDFWMERLLAPLDLSSGPLFRVSTITQGSLTYVFMDMHHIISDGRTIEVLMEDFHSLYSGKQLTPVTAQFRHYAEWQTKMLDSDEGASHQLFWRGMLGEEPKPLLLPTDYSRPEVQTFTGGTVMFEFNDELSMRILKYAEENHYTLYMLMLGVYSVLLSQYSGERKLIIGTPVSGRTQIHYEHTAGMFVNTLPLQLDLDTDLSFASYLKQVKESVLDGFDHQDYPLEELVRQLSLDRSAGGTPLISTLLAVEGEEHKSASELLKPAILQEWKDDTVKFDLAVTVREISGKLRAEVQYAANLYKRETAGMIAQHFSSIAEQMISDDLRPLSSIQLVSTGQDMKAKLQSFAEDIYEFDF